MSVIVQDNDGAVDGANSYIDLAYFRAYHEERGVDTSAHLDAVVEGALVRARDYIDTRFPYRGYPVVDETAFPRLYGAAEGVPSGVKKAQAEYTLKALESSLYVDAVPSTTGREVIEETKKLGPLEKTTKFSTSGQVTNTVPVFPLADRLLAPFRKGSRNTVVRA